MLAPSTGVGGIAHPRVLVALTRDILVIADPGGGPVLALALRPGSSLIFCDGPIREMLPVLRTHQLQAIFFRV